MAGPAAGSAVAALRDALKGMTEAAGRYNKLTLKMTFQGARHLCQGLALPWQSAPYRRMR